MKPEEIKARIEQEIISQQYPEMTDTSPTIESGPSESRLRALRRSRAILSESELQSIPVEHKFIYQLQEDGNRPFDKTVVIVTNDDGQAQYIIESK